MGEWKGPEDKANRNGRPRGARNKTTNAIREAYQNLVEMNLENMSGWIAEVAAEDPQKAMDLMIKLSEYIKMKMKNLLNTSPRSLSHGTSSFKIGVSTTKKGDH